MTRSLKVLTVLGELAGPKKRPVTFEKVVVKAFETFPEEFSLRGYPQYPDAAGIRKLLYDTLKPKGLVRIVNTTCLLTEKGQKSIRAQPVENTNSKFNHRLTRHQEVLLKRQMSSEAVKLVAADKTSELIDTDCQRFYGLAPWTTPETATEKRDDFLAILNSIEATDPKTARLLKRTDQELQARFRHLFRNGDGAH